MGTLCRYLLIIVILHGSLILCGQAPSDAPDTAFYTYRNCKVSIPITFSNSQKSSLKSSETLSRESRKLLLTGTGELTYQHFNREGQTNNLLLMNARSDIASVRLSLVYKEIYPFSVFFRYNKSSPFQLDNQYELNLGFDDRGYKEILREKISGLLKNTFLAKHTQLLNNYTSIYNEFEEKRQLLQSPAYLQQVVQNRFQHTVSTSLPDLPTVPSVNGIPSLNNPAGLLNGRVPDIGTLRNPAARLQSALDELPGIDQIKARLQDSANRRLAGIAEGFHNRLAHKRDSLQGLLKKYEDSLAAQKAKLSKELDSLNREISELYSVDELKAYASAKGLKDSLKKNRWADILMKTNLRFGKFILNNSELTINNIFLHGVSVKYGDKKFVQVSAGYYDFAFRELFNFRRDTIPRSKQHVTGIRIGRTDGRNLRAINFYIGRKDKQGSLTGELRTVAGVSLERKFFINKNLKLHVEVAKSTTRLNDLTNKQESTIKDLFGSVSARTMGAYGAANIYLPKTKTDAEFDYRYWGQQFESFNASQYFNPRNNLSGKISQPLFNRKLHLNATLRYTDFKSYGIASNVKTKTVFASLNATVRIKKLPIISVGYYPGSQLYWMDNSRLYEYYYYILNTTISHYFTVFKMPMQTVFTYNKFFNKYTDSIVSGSQSFYNIFWTAWANRFSYQANYSRQELENNSLSTAEAGVTYSALKIRLGGTVKWNFLDHTTRMGYTGSFGLSLGKTGTVNLIYDQSFLPDLAGRFIPINTGQIQIIKPLKFRIWQKG